MPDGYAQYDHVSFGEGINRVMAVTNPEYPKGAVWDALNCIYQRDTNDIEKMGGMARLGTTAMGGTVTGLFDFNEGTRLIALCSDGKLYEYAGSDWAVATGGTGLTASAALRFSAHMFYGATTLKNLLVVCNGTDAPQRYDNVNGMAILGGSPPATGQYPVSFGGSVYMASGSTLFKSVVNDVEDWSGTGSGNIQVDRGSGIITGLTVFAGNLLIFKRRKVFRLIPGSTFAEASIREVSHTIGCVSNQTIDEVGTLNDDREALFFLSENGVRALVPTNTTGGFAARNVSERVKPLIDRRSKANQDTAWATFYDERGEYYLQYGTSTNVPTEGLICNSARERKPIRWTRHNLANMTAGTVWRSSGTELQVMADTNGKVYQLHSGDTRDGVSYRGFIYSAAFVQGKPGAMKEYGSIYADIQANGNYPIHVKYILGRQGKMPAPGGGTVSVADLGFSGGFGEGTFGVAVWGGTEAAGTWVRPKTTRRGRFLRIQIETSGPDTWFKWDGLSVEANVTSDRIAA